MKELMVRIRDAGEPNWFEIAGRLKDAEARGLRINSRRRKSGSLTVTAYGDVVESKVIDVLVEIIALLDAENAESFDITVRTKVPKNAKEVDVAIDSQQPDHLE
jgi:hypothetical protein